ncbi:MAG: hypothetical protein HQM10_10770 [Candidatus Riflebacteria bacterium]|nr:hypothetical protein [Candidatus Riflebacteria bacterium]
MKNNVLLSTLFLVFLIVISFTFQWTFKASYPDLYLPDVSIETPIDAAVEAIPISFRRFVAGYLWMRADEYMHFGPTRKLARDFLAGFTAGSYAGNTDIIPLIQLALMFDPQFIDGYEILAMNLCMYLNRFKEGIRTLQHGIIANKLLPGVHELYGTIGYIYFHIEKYDTRHSRNIESALKYFGEALLKYEKNPGEKRVDVMRPGNYHLHRSRIFVEKGMNDKALEEYKLSGLDLNSQDLLAVYLSKFQRGEQVPCLPEDLPEYKLLEIEPDLPKPVPNNQVKPTLDSEGHPKPPSSIADTESLPSDEEQREHAMEAYGPKRDNSVFYRVIGQICFMFISGGILWIRRGNS